MTPGIYIGLPEAKYRAVDALSQSAIKDMAERSPLGWRFGPKQAASRAMDFGSVAHALALGVGAFEVSPYDDFRTKEAREWRDAQTLPIIKRELHLEAIELGDIMADAIEDRVGEAKWHPEVSMFWEMDGVPCKARMDVWCPEMTIIDLKTTGNGLSDAAVERFFEAYGCAVQSRFYRLGLETLKPELAGRIRFETMIFETAKPYQHRVCVNSGMWDEVADMRIARALADYKRGIETGHWRGFDTIPLAIVPRHWTYETEVENA